MSENTTAAAAGTPIPFEAVEAPLTRRGPVTVIVTVEATTLAGDVPTQEAVAQALAILGVGQRLYIRDASGKTTGATITAVTLA